MRQRITNTLTATFDVYGVSFESAGALGFVNEFSGLAIMHRLTISLSQNSSRHGLIVILAD
jgi:hypothetical protein